MSLTLAQRHERLVVRLAELEFWKVRETAAVATIACDGAAIAVGAPWPRRDGLVRFALTGEVPAAWPLADTRLSLDLGGESLIAIACGDGAPVPYGLDPYHQSFPLTARRFSVTTETVARLPFGEPVRQPVVNRAELQLREPAVDRLWLLLTQIVEALSAGGRRGPDRLLDLMLQTGPYGAAFGAGPADGASLDLLVEHPHGVDFGAMAPRLPEVLQTPSQLVELDHPVLLDDLDRLAGAMDELAARSMVLSLVSSPNDSTAVLCSAISASMPQVTASLTLLSPCGVPAGTGKRRSEPLSFLRKRSIWSMKGECRSGS